MTELTPSSIYFTHSKIRSRFSGCNKLLSETLEEILNNQITVRDIPKIRVIYDKATDRYYSMNNRRLWVFKELEKTGKITTIPVELRVAVSNSEKKLGASTLSLVAKVSMN